MLVLVKKIFKSFGVDYAIAYSLLARLIQAGGGVLSVYFIAKYLTKVEQGFYFTFNSILAIQLFFELGFNTIITQFVAHEMAHLNITANNKLDGNKANLSRLSSLLHFCGKWFILVSIGLFAILQITGYIFFSKYGQTDEVNWMIPWLLLSFATSCNLLASPILAFLEGLGKVSNVARLRLIQQASSMLILFTAFMIGSKLYSSAIASSIAILLIMGALWFSSEKKLLSNIWESKGPNKINYKIEIFPYQWRIALSWMASFFIFQLFNPVLFATQGPTQAGQMGITMAALNGVSAISISWINTKVPVFSTLIAKGDFGLLNQRFTKALIQAILVNAAGLLFFILVLCALDWQHLTIRERFLPMLPIALMCLSTVATQAIHGLATFVRCHKTEPFLIQSIIVGILYGTSTIFLGKYYGALGITIGFCVITLFIALPWVIIIFRRKFKLWYPNV